MDFITQRERESWNGLYRFVKVGDEKRENLSRQLVAFIRWMKRRF